MPEKPYVVRTARETADTAQTTGAKRVAGVSPAATPGYLIWLGKVSNGPGYRSVPHHHGVTETAGYVLKGSARIYFGDNYQDYVNVEEEDFVFVPPGTPYIEANRSPDAELVWMTARTPDNIFGNPPDVDEADLRNKA